jgi:hypothetical protein
MLFKTVLLCKCLLKFLPSSAANVYTQKNFWRIINPEKGFVTAKSAYQRALPFDKTFFLKKVGKGLSPVAN